MAREEIQTHLSVTSSVTSGTNTCHMVQIITDRITDGVHIENISKKLYTTTDVLIVGNY